MRPSCAPDVAAVDGGVAADSVVGVVSSVSFPQGHMENEVRMESAASLFGPFTSFSYHNYCA